MIKMEGKKIKDLGKKSKKKLKAEAWKLLSLFLRKKYPQCQICGAPVQAIHHIIHKAHGLSVYFDENNLIAVCTSCNLKFHISTGFTPKDINDIAIRIHGEKYIRVKQNRHVKTKFSHYDYEDMIANYKLRIQELENEY